MRLGERYGGVVVWSGASPGGSGEPRQPSLSSLLRAALDTGGVQGCTIFPGA